METIQNKYVPGVCNIGDEEIKKRKQAGRIGLIAAIVLWALFIWFDVPSIWRLTIFFPAMMSATGFLQAYMHFCAGFGMKGLFNFGAEVGKTDNVEQAELHAKDKRKAWQIIIYAVIIGTAIAFLAYLF